MGLRDEALAVSDFAYVKPFNTTMFEFERRFDEETDEHILWMRQNWPWTMLFSVVYIILVFWGKSYMASRERYQLRTPLAIWSSTLAVFSIAGMWRTVPEILYMLTNYGYRMSVCNPSAMWGPCAFWDYYFAVSKLFELGDTMFIVLRKQPLILLHWYHHITVMMYCWFTYGEANVGPSRWFMTMNYTVHSLMYTYYALRACRVTVPKQVNILITSMQLLQMVMGLVAIISVYAYQKLGYACPMSTAGLVSGYLMYLSYLILFAQFFYKTYLAPTPPRKTDAKITNGVGNGHVKKN